MAQIVKLRRSAVTGNKPTTSQLELGELAMNTYDGKIYFEKSGSAGESIEEILITNTQNTGSLSISGSSHNITGALELSGSLKLPTTVRDYTNSTGSVGQVLQVTENGAVWVDNTASSTGDGRTAKQTFSALTTWTFNHNLNEQYPVIELYDSNNQVIIPSTITATSSNTLTITFAVPVAGTAVATVGGMRGYQGYQGAQGSDGYIGADGAQGPQGTQGYQGYQGFQGDQGFQGTQGDQGYQGFQGDQGDQGYQGAQGDQGYQGAQGDQGYQGAQGDQGDQGYQGAQGDQGYQGAQGDQGITGDQGFQGVQGPQGDQGATGAQGAVSSSARNVNLFTATAGQTTFTVPGGYTVNLVDVFWNGVKQTVGVDYTASNGTTVVLANAAAAGDTIEIDNYLGEIGSQGVQGAAGAQGATGPQGSIGAQGATGPQGAVGAQGDVGDQGSVGPQGIKGDQGFQGPTGLQGSKGDQGDQGATGLQGTTGAQGVTGAQGATGTANINGTGFIKATGDVISYDNNTYLTTSSASSTYQTILTNPVTGTGSVGQIAYWSSGSAISGENNLFWDASNNRLGINTASPAQSLDVVGKSRFTDDLILAQTNGRIDYDNGVSTGALRFFSTSGNTERMRLTSSGNLMVGSANAGNAGTINVSVGVAGTTAGGLQLWAATNQTHFIQFGDGTTGAQVYAGYLAYAHSTDSLLFGTNGSDKMVLNASGNLSLGNTNDTYKLDVTGTGRFGGTNTYNGFLIGSHSNNVGAAIYNKGNAAQTLYADNSSTVLNAEVNLYLRTGNTDRLTIASTGAATFSSSVTATSFEVGNGQYFKARRISGNLLLDLLGIESGTDNTRLLITGDFNIKNGSLTTLLNMTTTGASTFASSITANGRIHASRYGNSSGGSFLMGIENNSESKWSYLCSTQYNSSSNPSGFSIIGGFTSATENKVIIGGSIYEANPSTSIEFWTHTAVTHSTGGTLRMRITTDAIKGAIYFDAQSLSGFRIRNAADSANAGGFTRRGLWEGNANYDPGMWAETGYGLYFYSNGSADIRAYFDTSGHFVPGSNNTYNLGSSSNAWANIYTNDLHLSNMNKEGGNDIDGTSGTWTIQEGAEDLYIINNRNNKKFKIKLEEII